MGSNFSRTDYLEFARTLDTALLSEDRLDVAVEWIREHLAPADVFDNVHGEGDCDYSDYTHDDDVASQLAELRRDKDLEIVELTSDKDRLDDKVTELEDKISELEEALRSRNEEAERLEEKISDLETTIHSLENELRSHGF